MSKIKVAVVGQNIDNQIYKVTLDEYKKNKHKSIAGGKLIVFDKTTGETKRITTEEYYANSAQFITATKGKVLAKDKNGKNTLVTTEEFKSGNYVGQTQGLRTVLNKETNQYVQITKDEFDNNRSKYSGPNNGKVNVINKKTGVRCQIPKSDFDRETYAGLGNKTLLFLCRNILTGKEKNINIYEWPIVKDNYCILEIDKFNKANELK